MTTSQLWPHTVAVLCGGHSRRMGRPKAALMLPSGRSLLGTVVSTAREVAGRVGLVGENPCLPSDVVPDFHLSDEKPGLGPIGGLLTLLKSGLDSEYLVLPCDAFRITTETLCLLTRCPDPAPIVLRHSGQREPLWARYPVSLASSLERQSLLKDTSLMTWLDQISPTYLEVPPPLWPTLANANTPEDLKTI